MKNFKKILLLFICISLSSTNILKSSDDSQELNLHKKNMGNVFKEMQNIKSPNKSESKLDEKNEENKNDYTITPAMNDSIIDISISCGEETLSDKNSTMNITLFSNNTLENKSFLNSVESIETNNSRPNSPFHSSESSIGSNENDHHHSNDNDHLNDNEENNNDPIKKQMYRKPKLGNQTKFYTTDDLDLLTQDEENTIINKFKKYKNSLSSQNDASLQQNNNNLVEAYNSDNHNEQKKIDNFRIDQKDKNNAVLKQSAPWPPLNKSNEDDQKYIEQTALTNAINDSSIPTDEGKKEAATIIQKIYRGHNSRQKSNFEKIRSELNNLLNDNKQYDSKDEDPVENLLDQLEISSLNKFTLNENETKAIINYFLQKDNVLNKNSVSLTDEDINIIANIAKDLKDDSIINYLKAYQLLKKIPSNFHNLKPVKLDNNAIKEVQTFVNKHYPKNNLYTTYLQYNYAPQYLLEEKQNEDQSDEEYIRTKIKEHDYTDKKIKEIYSEIASSKNDAPTDTKTRNINPNFDEVDEEDHLGEFLASCLVTLNKQSLDWYKQLYLQTKRTIIGNSIAPDFLEKIKAASTFYELNAIAQEINEHAKKA